MIEEVEAKKSDCQQIKEQYEYLKALKKEFDLELEKARKTGDLKKVKSIRQELEIKKESLENALSEEKKAAKLRNLSTLERIAMEIRDGK